MTGYAIRVWSKRISQQLCAFQKIPQARVFGAANAINVEQILLYQHIGDRIGRDILKSEHPAVREFFRQCREN